MVTLQAPGGAARWRLRLSTSILTLIAVLGLASCGGKREPDAAQKMTMRPSVTYLHLLRHTPFFTALSTAQLRWVIDHSREWEADAGAVIATCDHGVEPDAPYWILLDGGWQVEHAGRTVRSGHADPGKWFSAAEAHGESCVLVTNEHSYVMRIERADMLAMLDQQFGFRTHLDSGIDLYRSIFGDRTGTGRVQVVQPSQPVVGH
ncbi:hypothetical protein PQR70_02420 [Paraburkholderia madseniana]|uniref:Uncharacterized protein n=1 Tax=Paraburkholderia madseniana TaxID=2599607 RepID=A0AAP5B972_9BURK|nr:MULTISPECIES: hypothetical protein [Paraburkholderia]MCX4145454.1 hypothetical protein [Paraburkholderia madseniana]MDN7148403.1 hypothetical protein [Paraburkholderia sp. WS6]MDQ6407283.1 hypothetical protein [Paraburkholderia madseniana]